MKLGLQGKEGVSTSIPGWAASRQRPWGAGVSGMLERRQDAAQVAEEWREDLRGSGEAPGPGPGESGRLLGFLLGWEALDPLPHGSPGT